MTTAIENSTGFTLKKAVRKGIIPLIGMYGKSGSGKTFSALTMARGLVGPTGRIGIVDTENGRAQLCADLIEGGYEVIQFDPPFTPERYAECQAVLEANCDIGIYDSLSHLWEGEGGILESHESELERKAGDDWKKREANKMSAWIKPKARYKAWAQRILRSKIPLICCLRGQEKTHIDKGKGDGKARVVTDDFCSPIFDPRFIFEMLVNLETTVADGKPGCAVVRKYSHPKILGCLPKEGEQITAAHGQALAKWCAGTGSEKPADEAASLKKQLWTKTKSVHGGNADKLEAWLKEKTLLGENEPLAELSPTQLKWLLGQLEIIM